ncbi:MAG: hypothetical protein E7K15_25505, partial [Klebsiella michiganensis]|nr:hypothetical protein [Klebsiella michiganensis]
TARWDIARHGNIYAGSYRNRKREKASGYIGSNPYIQSWSLLLDIKIVFLTFFRGFVGKNAF